MKYKAKQPEFKTREAPPKIKNTKKGVVIGCPFCNPPHPILPGVISPCGTMLKVIAVQVYFPSHYTKRNGLKCMKCGEGGGTMIKFQNGYVHMEECAPEKTFVTEVPKFSKMAKFIFGLPEKMRTAMEKRYGTVKEVQEIDGHGQPTGKILGYVFWKEKVTDG